MTDSRSTFDAAMRQFASDKAFRAECRADGRTFLRAADAEPAENVNVKTHVNDANSFHFVIPTQPPSIARELGDSEIASAAGGGGLTNNILAFDPTMPIAEHITSFTMAFDISVMDDLNARFLRAAGEI